MSGGKSGIKILNTLNPAIPTTIAIINKFLFIFSFILIQAFFLIQDCKGTTIF